VSGDLRGESHPRSHRRPDHRDHERGARGGRRTPLGILANYWFSIVSSIVLAFVAYVVTERIVEPRLGAWVPESDSGPAGTSVEDEADDVGDASAEKRGLRFALIFFVAFIGFVLLITLPPGAPLRDPETGDIIGRRRSWTACCSSSR
jgi:aminobenzoyl-glutamate transport protein